MIVYADNAATTRPSDTALSTMFTVLKGVYGNPSSVHQIGQKARYELLKARKTIAKCINANPSEIIFTSGGSESDNQAVYTAAFNGLKSGRNHIITSQIEHPAILSTLKYLETKGFEISYAENDAFGNVDLESIKRQIRPETCLCTVMTANNEIGTIQDIEGISKICRENKVIFHTDAVQAAGHIKIDVKKSGVDMLSASAHKFGGAKGAGFLYVRGRDENSGYEGINLFSLIRGGGQEKGKRAGTENVPAIAAMSSALLESCENLEENYKKTLDMKNHLILKLSKIKNVFFNGDRNNSLPGIINITIQGISAEVLLLMLDEMGICASAGSACSSGSLSPSHVLTAIGMNEENAKSTLRISLNHENSLKECDYIAECIENCINKIRK